MREKFLLSTRHCDRAAMARLFDRLQGLEGERGLDWIKVDAGARRSGATQRRRPAGQRGARQGTGTR
jgi:hypothetical protein